MAVSAEGEGKTASAGARGVDLRAAGQAGEHYVTAVATGTRVKGAHKSANCKAIELRFDRRKNQRCAFTMAEILLSLTIIGVVAAITLPSLTGNINERTWNTQRKALYARFSQAIALMPAVNGYGNYSGTNTDGVVSVTEDTAAETFITEGLSKVLKINNICDADHLADCGIVSSYTNMAASVNALPTKLSELNSRFTIAWASGWENPHKDVDTAAAAFETANGESIVVYYNPYCTSDEPAGVRQYSQTKMCVNFIYDLNGNKGPNTVGKDIGFITALYPSDTVVVAPMPALRNVSEASPPTDGGRLCSQQDNENRMPNRDELAAMFYNKELIGIVDGAYWSSSADSPTQGWKVSFNAGDRFTMVRTYPDHIRCIKR